MPEYSVKEIINDINHSFFLPAIQRSFVWNDDFICKLLDSLCSGYPIGSITTWETYEEIEYRQFIKGSFRRSHKGTYDIDKVLPNSGPKNLVLDGQQRLQSLFLAFKGRIDGKLLYLNLLYEGDDDKSEAQYDFQFLDDDNEFLSASFEQIEKRKFYPIAVKNIFQNQDTTAEYVKRLIQRNSELKKFEDIISRNVAAFLDMLNSENRFHLIEIDKGMDAADPKRKNISEILEVFVRINQQQTRLSRADLIFSTLKMQKNGIAQSVDGVLEELNANHNLKVDLNFLIRCMFVTSDLGSKLDLKVLSKYENVEKISKNFSACITAISSVLDFVCADLQLIHSKQISGLNTIIPFVYFAYNCPDHKLPTKNRDKAKKAFYLLSLSRSLSRWGEARIAAMVKNDLGNLEYTSDDLEFPYSKVISWVAYWEGISDVSNYLLGLNPHLVFTLIQGRTVQATHNKENSLELDHIYPRKILNEKAVESDVINSIGNLWLLPRGANRNKSAKPPKEFLQDALQKGALQKGDLTGAKIDGLESLHGNGHRKFIKNREQKLLNSFLKKTGIKQSDFHKAGE